MCITPSPWVWMPIVATRTAGGSGGTSPQTLKAMAWWMWSPSCGTPPRSSFCAVVPGVDHERHAQHHHQRRARPGTGGCGADRRTRGRPGTGRAGDLLRGRCLTHRVADPTRAASRATIRARDSGERRRGRPRRARRRWRPDRTAAARSRPGRGRGRPGGRGRPAGRRGPSAQAADVARGDEEPGVAHDLGERRWRRWPPPTAPWAMRLGRGQPEALVAWTARPPPWPGRAGRPRRRPGSGPGAGPGRGDPEPVDLGEQRRPRRRPPGR